MRLGKVGGWAIVLACAVLLVACGEPADADGDGSSGPQKHCLTCSTYTPSCHGTEGVSVCVEDSSGCGMSQVMECPSTSSCEDGACRPCPGGCCSTCEPWECGAATTDGCGGVCGATVASEMSRALAEAYCEAVFPCCSEPRTFCLWTGLSGCISDTEAKLRGPELWCDLAVELCMKDIQDYSCEYPQIPSNCELVFENQFEILGGPTSVPASVDAGTDSGVDAGVLMQCVGTVRRCYDADQASCESVEGCEYTDGRCAGAFTRCESPRNESDCIAESSLCHWEDGCVGTARRCENTPLGVCASVPGCSLMALSDGG